VAHADDDGHAPQGFWCVNQQRRADHPAPRTIWLVSHIAVNRGQIANEGTIQQTGGPGSPHSPKRERPIVKSLGALIFNNSVAQRKIKTSRQPE